MLDTIQMAKFEKAIHDMQDVLRCQRNDIETLKTRMDKQDQVIDYLHEKILQIERDNFRVWVDIGRDINYSTLNDENLEEE